MVRTEHARLAKNGMVCTVDHLASVAGTEMLSAGGNAVDAAVASSAALAVTAQNMCGMGGDLWALVHVPGESVPFALNASGWAGAGSDAAAMRSEGLTEMPFRGDFRSVPVPGCVDGWVALHERFGVLPLAAVLAPAIRLATNGFPVSPILARRLHLVADVVGAGDYIVDGALAKEGQIVCRPGLARSLGAIGEQGRSGWYEGEFGEALVRRGGGIFDASDMSHQHAEWVEPVSVEAWSHKLWSVPPNSQGYISLAAASIADGLELPVEPDDPLWAHYLIEASKQAAHDRPAVLFDGAAGDVLVSESRLGSRRELIEGDRALDVRPPTAGGGTIYLCTTDSDRMGVSLIQSNASGFGAHLALPEVGVFLHNRGIGFSLTEGHPAELMPGMRPPSTLAPAVATRADGSLRSVFGCMGGDAQPQIVLQMAARLLQAGQRPGLSLTEPRFALTVPAAHGFDTWSADAPLTVAIESGSPWGEGLRRRGHLVEEREWGLGLFGHAHMIDVGDDYLAGVADPRSLIGAAVGI